MKTILIFAFGVYFSTIASAQDSSSRIKIYTAKIKCFENKKLIKGPLYDFNDSTIILINARSKAEVIDYQLQFNEIQINNIDRMKIRRKGKIGSYTILGALIGGSAGVAIGYSQGDNEPPCGDWMTKPCWTAGDKAVLLGIPLTLVGGITGALIGTHSKRIDIDGKHENIIINQEILSKYSIINQIEKSQ